MRSIATHIEAFYAHRADREACQTVFRDRDNRNNSDRFESLVKDLTLSRLRFQDGECQERCASLAMANYDGDILQYLEENGLLSPVGSTA